MKKVFLIIPCLIILMLPLSVWAYQTKTGTSVYVNKDETVAGNLYAAGMNITVDGKVNGDVICAGQTININGEVAGDVICAGQVININGKIGGSVRSAGNAVMINNSVARNVMAFGASVILGDKAEIGWDVLTAGAVVDIKGKINGDLTGAGANYFINAEIKKNVKLILDAQSQKAKNKTDQELVTITKDAKIGGDFIYTAASDAKIEDGAKITGKTERLEPKLKASKKTVAMTSVWSGIVCLFSSIVVGLILITIGKRQLKDTFEIMNKKIWPTLGWGLVVAFIGPIVLILLMITIIGIPLALIIGALWLIALYISKIITGLLIGQWLLIKFWKSKKESMIWALVIGIVIVCLISPIPVIGWLFAFIITLWGLGGIWQYLLSLKK